jgi:hypothetical protein
VHIAGEQPFVDFASQTIEVIDHATGAMRLTEIVTFKLTGKRSGHPPGAYGADSH